MITQEDLDVLKESITILSRKDPEEFLRDFTNEEAILASKARIIFEKITDYEPLVVIQATDVKKIFEILYAIASRIKTMEDGV